MSCGWAFLDWADEELTDEDRDRLAAAADQTIGEIHRSWADIRRRPRGPAATDHALGLMETDAYLELAARSFIPVRSTREAPASRA